MFNLHSRIELLLNSNEQELDDFPHSNSYPMTGMRIASEALFRGNSYKRLTERRNDQLFKK